MMVKTTETNCLGISVYPTTEARETFRKLSESRVLGELKHLFQEDFRLAGEVVVKHIF
tara:strand:+ start:190 stop:363 length:174 start_codon:yes stop_codon:yes gene_type:complete